MIEKIKTYREIGVVTDLKTALDSLSTAELKQVYNTSLRVISNDAIHMPDEHYDNFLELTAFAIAIERKASYMDDAVSNDPIQYTPENIDFFKSKANGDGL